MTPAASEVTYPALLADLPAPRLRAYPKYTVIAEKFQALCVLGPANSRMKDYFDMWLLTNGSDIEPGVLRYIGDLRVPSDGTAGRLATGLTPQFATDATKQTQWREFLRKNFLTAPAVPDIVQALRDRLATPLQIVREDQQRASDHRLLIDL